VAAFNIHIGADNESFKRPLSEICPTCDPEYADRMEIDWELARAALAETLAKLAEQVKAADGEYMSGFSVTLDSGVVMRGDIDER
jgi:hypothetical protein